MVLHLNVKSVCALGEVQRRTGGVKENIFLAKPGALVPVIAIKMFTGKKLEPSVIKPPDHQAQT